MVRTREKNVIVSGRGPIVSVAMGLIFSSAIVYNALGRQHTDHPAPIPALWFEEVLEMPDAGEEENAILQRRDRQDDVQAQGSELVSALQTELAAMDYYSGDIDGLMGPMTEAAIRQYQSDNNLAVTGAPSENLLEHAGYTRRIREALTLSSQSGAVQEEQRVMLIQTGLAEMGYYPGTIDGMMGEQTRTAIRQFERDRNLSVTGEISEALIRELRNVTGLSTLGGQQLS